MDNSDGSSVEEIKSESTDILDEVKNTFEKSANILNSFSDADSGSDTEIEEYDLPSSDNIIRELETQNPSEKMDDNSKKELSSSSDPNEESIENIGNSEVEDTNKPIPDSKDLRKDADQENQSGKKENESSIETGKNSSKENSEYDKVKLMCPDLDSADPFEVVVPLIGKREFPATMDKPFARRYDLAMEINRRKGIEQREETKKFMEYKKRRDARTPEEVELHKRLEKISAMHTSSYLTKRAVRILRELTNEEGYDEDYIIKYLTKFMDFSVTYLGLIYSPHWVHTVMYIRGCEALSDRLRRYANECYWKCHAFFGIPDGYNFQTVYMSDVKKYGMKGMEHCMESIDHARDYGDYDEPDSSDSDDSAFYELDSNSNDS